MIFVVLYSSSSLFNLKFKNKVKQQHPPHIHLFFVNMVWGEIPGYSWPREKHAMPARFVRKPNCSKLLWEIGGSWACGSFALHFCFPQEISAAANQVIHSGKFKEQSGSCCMHQDA